MKYYRIEYEVYEAAGKGWERMTEELLLLAIRKEGKEHGGKVVRLAFFTFCEDSREYQLQRFSLEQWVDDHSVSPRPVLSLVAQKPLVGELVMEAHSLPVTAGEEVTVEEQMTSSVRYLRITSGHYREIIAGGLYADDLTLPVREQSEQVLGKAEEILRAEQISFGDIVRRQSYLERVTDVVYGNQCYQGFNDTRPQFYAPSEWASEYPAATGIGTQHDEILVNLNAVEREIEIVPLGNDWQRAVRVYSDGILISHQVGAEKETPKLEGGESSSDHQQEMIYVSGTIATRGGENIVTGDVFVQTEIALGNIQRLIGLEEGRKRLPEHSSRLELPRAYLRHEEDAKIVKEDVGKLCPDVLIVYLYADVCREELLIEIGGVAYL